MDKFDRIFQLHTILSGRRTPIPLEDLTARMECSKPTLHRTIAMMRTYLNAPIQSTMEGYRYGPRVKARHTNYPDCGSPPQSCRRSQSCTGCSPILAADCSKSTSRRWRKDWTTWRDISD